MASKYVLWVEGVAHRCNMDESSLFFLKAYVRLPTLCALWPYLDEKRQAAYGPNHVNTEGYLSGVIDAVILHDRVTCIQCLHAEAQNIRRR